MMIISQKGCGYSTINGTEKKRQVQVPLRQKDCESVTAWL